MQGFLVALFGLFLSLILPYPAWAQTPSISRFYLPLSSNITAVKEGEKVSLLTKDYLSSTRSIIDQTSKTNTISYTPYGSSVNANPPAGGLNSKTDKLFTGHRKLDGVSVYHAGARYYSPTLGTFIQPDKVQGPNRYAYVNNNPILLNDPTGHCAGCVNDLQVIDIPLSQQDGGIRATGTYDPERIDRALMTDNQLFALQVFTGAIALPVVAAEVGVPVALTAFTACLGNMPGCQSFIADIGVGEGSTIPVAPVPIARVSQMKNLAVEFWHDESGQVLNTTDGLLIIPGAISRLSRSQSPLGRAIKTATSSHGNVAKASVEWNNLYDGIEDTAHMLSLMHGGPVNVNPVTLDDYLYILAAEDRLGPGYTRLAEQVDRLEKYGGEIAEQVKRVPIAYRFEKDGNIVGELYGFHDDLSEMIKGTSTGTPWNMTLMYRGKNYLLDVNLTSGLQIPAALQHMSQFNKSYQPH